MSTCHPQDGSAAIAECIASLKHNSKSFSFASLMFSPEIRGDVAVLYAWCRRADDAVDEVPIEDAPGALKRLEAELEAVYSSVRLSMADPTLAAFQDLVWRCDIPKHYPSSLLKGMRMDIERSSYQSVDELYLYCYRVASVVGLMMCHVTGLKGEAALAEAAQLGVAMQLTNICRDVSEDWARGRLYIPLELLGLTEMTDEYRGLELLNGATGRRFGSAPLPERLNERVRAGTKHLLALAESHYQGALKGVNALPIRAALSVQIAAYVYRHIGRLVMTRGADPMAPRAVTSLPQKVSLAARAVCVTALERALHTLRSLGGSRVRVTRPQHTLRYEELKQSLARGSVKGREAC